jgi:hypothetical protein
MSLYSHVFRKILMPLHGMLRNRQYSHYLDSLERSQWWSREQLLEFQWQELRRLLEYSDQCLIVRRSTGTLVSGLPTYGPERILPGCPCATGKSSGAPTRFFLTIDSYDWRTHAQDRVYSWSGWRPCEKAPYLWALRLASESLSGQNPCIRMVSAPVGNQYVLSGRTCGRMCTSGFRASGRTLSWVTSPAWSSSPAF